MLKLELQNFIIDNYKDINSVISIKRVTEGYLSQNYILEATKGKFFLKQYRDRYTTDSIREVHRVADFFSQNDIPVILPFKSRKGKTYFQFGKRIYSLFPFVSGVRVERKDTDREYILSLARTLAKIHLLSLNGPPVQISAIQGPVDSESFFENSEMVLDVLSSIKEKSPFDRLVLEGMSLKKSIVENNINRIKSLEVKTDHLLHGDYHEQNVFFDDSSDVKYVFDLEKTELGDRLHELIRSMDYVCLNEEYNEVGIERARLYLHTYNSLYPIKKEVFLNTLEDYFLKKANSLWIEKTHYLEGSNRVDCFLEKQLASLKFYPNNYEKLGELLEA